MAVITALSSKSNHQAVFARSECETMHRWPNLSEERRVWKEQYLLLRKSLLHTHNGPTIIENVRDSSFLV